MHGCVHAGCVTDPRLSPPGAAHTHSRRPPVNIRRFAVVSLLLAIGIGLAGCGTNSQPGAAPTTPAQVSPAAALTNALATLTNTGYDATLTIPQGATVKTSV